MVPVGVLVVGPLCHKGAKVQTRIIEGLWIQLSHGVQWRGRVSCDHQAPLRHWTPGTL